MRHRVALFAAASLAFACSKPEASDKATPSAPAPVASSASAPVASSVPTPVPSAPPAPSASAAPGNFACEITKRLHTCQLSKPPCAGPCGEGMFACPPEESSAVNATFKILGDAKAAVAACG